jgi:hypothetical protein
MAAISGYWEFHRACPAQSLTIVGVDDAGALYEANIDDETIHGHYDTNTNRITFNDARQPGETLYVSFYTGYVMPTEDGSACAMAGTFSEQELIFEPNPGWRITIPTFHGPWYAIWKGPIIA